MKIIITPRNRDIITGREYPTTIEVWWDYPERELVSEQRHAMIEWLRETYGFPRNNKPSRLRQKRKSWESTIGLFRLFVFCHDERIAVGFRLRYG